jgi:hypothetical protein
MKDLSSGAKMKNNPRHQVPCLSAPGLALLYSNTAEHREQREWQYYGDASNVRKLSHNFSNLHFKEERNVHQFLSK